MTRSTNIYDYEPSATNGHCHPVDGRRAVSLGYGEYRWETDDEFFARRALLAKLAEEERAHEAAKSPEQREREAQYRAMSDAAKADIAHRYMRGGAERDRGMVTVRGERMMRGTARSLGWL